jgi:hypothetical protein
MIVVAGFIKGLPNMELLFGGEIHCGDCEKRTWKESETRTVITLTFATRFYTKCSPHLS